MAEGVIDLDSAGYRSMIREAIEEFGLEIGDELYDIGTSSN